tara:strand:- start:816 stop:2345 length:1530 start_codon:yes stop_codon:yes gene_type:complete
MSVVPYPVKNLKPKQINLQIETEFNFLSIALDGPRKNLENLVTWFMEEFEKDNVGLILKTGRSSGSIIDRDHTIRKLTKIVSRYQNHKCKLYLLHGDLTEEEIHSLYLRDDIHAYVTTTCGEGFGLPIFEAVYSGLPVIATDWSGHLDFLSAPYKTSKKIKTKKLFSRIDFDLQEIPHTAAWDGIVPKESRWAYAREHSFKTKTRKVYRDYGIFRKWAQALKEHILTTHEETKILQKMQEEILSIVPTVSESEKKDLTGLSFCIPTNGKKEEKTKLTIQSIKKQNWKDLPFEIILCGDVSNFKDVESVIRIDRKVQAHSRNVSHLRNTAASKSKYNEIVFCDDDQILDPGWLDGLRLFSKNEAWQVLGNKVLNPDGSRHWDRSLLEPHILVDYEHPKDDKKLYQSSGFFLVRRSVLDKVKWDETKLVHADKEGGVPEDVQFSLDLINSGFVLSFNEWSQVWHYDDTYMEINFGKYRQTLKKDLLREKFGFEFFPPRDQDFESLLQELEK